MNGDDGFTLPELLIAIVISSLLISVMSAVLIMSLKTNDKTSQRLYESHDAQVSANTYDRDAQSSDTVAFADADAVCNLAVSDGGYSLVLSFQWTEASATPPNDVYIADYLVQTRSGQQPALHRRLCKKPGGGSTLLQRDVIISDNLATSGSTAVTCDTMPCPSKPKTVALQVTEKSGYTFTMSAQRRPT